MNAKNEQLAKKKVLADTLLAIDGQTPALSAETQKITKTVLSRDQRRLQILTW